jgi:hypothetical protein
MVIEVATDVLVRVIDADPTLRRLVHGRWFYLAALSPDGPVLHEIGPEGPKPIDVEHPLPDVAGSSSLAYRGRRDHVDFARLDTERSTP